MSTLDLDYLLFVLVVNLHIMICLLYLKHFVFLLRDGVDLSTIAIWLGHKSIDTTHKYMVAGLVLKEKVLSKMNEADVDFRYKAPSEDILKLKSSL